MGILKGADQKRKDFYESIEKIYFLTNMDENEILENLQSLYHAIKNWEKNNKNKDKSDNILCQVRLVAQEAEERIIKPYNKGAVVDSLTRLSKYCQQAGSFKPGLLTVGAVLDYKKSKEKFKNLSKELDKLAGSIDIV